MSTFALFWSTKFSEPVMVPVNIVWELFLNVKFSEPLMSPLNVALVLSWTITEPVPLMLPLIVALLALMMANVPSSEIVSDSAPWPV
jgi:hypothetical protein